MEYTLIFILLVLLIIENQTIERFEGSELDEETQVYDEIDTSNKKIYKNYLIDGIMVVSIIILFILLIYGIYEIISKRKFKLSKIDVSYEKALKSIGKKKIIKMKK